MLTLALVSPFFMVASTNYAGFWKRLVAYVLDAIVLYAIIRVIGMFMPLESGIAEGMRNPLASPTFLVSVVLGWLYFALQESSVRQATLGKMALKIIVTDANGNRITLGRATGRHFAKYISGIILGIGYLMAAFTQKKQALHDMMAGTLVVKK